MTSQQATDYPLDDGFSDDSFTPSSELGELYQSAGLDPAQYLSTELFESVLDLVSQDDSDAIPVIRGVSRRWKRSVDSSKAAWSRLKLSTEDRSGRKSLAKARWWIYRALSARTVVFDITAVLGIHTTEDSPCTANDIAAIWAALAVIMPTVRSLDLVWDCSEVPPADFAGACFDLEDLKLASHGMGCFDFYEYLLHPDASRLRTIEDNWGHGLVIAPDQAKNLRSIDYSYVAERDCDADHHSPAILLRFFKGAPKLQRCNIQHFVNTVAAGSSPSILYHSALELWEEFGAETLLQYIRAPKLTAVALGPGWGNFMRLDIELPDHIAWNQLTTVDLRNYTIEDDCVDAVLAMLPRLASLRRLFLEIEGYADICQYKVLELLQEKRRCWPYLMDLRLLCACTNYPFCWTALRHLVRARQSRPGARSSVSPLTRLVVEYFSPPPGRMAAWFASNVADFMCTPDSQSNDSMFDDPLVVEGLREGR